MTLAATSHENIPHNINNESGVIFGNPFEFSFNPSLTESENFLSKLTMIALKPPKDHFEDCHDFSDNDSRKDHDTNDKHNNDTKSSDSDIPARSPSRPVKFKMVPDSPDMKLSDTSSVEYNTYTSDRSSQASIFSNENEDSLEQVFEEMEILELYGYEDVVEEKMVHKIEDVVEIKYESSSKALKLLEF